MLSNVRSVASGFFAGKMDTSKLNFIEQMIEKMRPSPQGDYLDWDAIKAWAACLAPLML